MKTYRLNHLIVKSITVAALLGMVCLAAALPATAEDSWKDQFEEICGKVQSADSMSDQEITAMMDKADKLLPVIQASDNPGKKVFITRLKRCRGVYEFMLDTRKTK